MSILRLATQSVARSGQAIRKLRRNRRPVLRGLTLIELMVAMALMTVLTGTIIFIFTQAQQIFVKTEAQVEVYQYVRTAFDQMERDLSNVVKTEDMDFYADANHNGHFDSGEELNGGIGIDQTEEVVLAKPMLGERYHYAMTLRQPSWYPATFDYGRPHSHDSLYFKTIGTFNGTQGQVTAQALVEYALVDMNQDRPKLQKRVWVATSTDGNGNPLINGPPIGTNAPGNTTPIVTDLCQYVTDVSIQFFVKNNRDAEFPPVNGAAPEQFLAGTYYSAQQLVQANEDPNTDPNDGMSPPSQGTGHMPTSGKVPFPVMRNFWNGPTSAAAGQGDFMVQCYYDPLHSGNPQALDFGYFAQAENGLFHTNMEDQFNFPMLGPADKIYIFQGPNTPTGLITNNEYTIQNWITMPNQMHHIQFSQNISTVGTTFPTQCEVAYRAGWLPPAVRVTLKIKDSNAKELRTVSRTFKVLASG